MKSFSGDEGYQAPCSPCLIEQESHIANYVVCIPLVSALCPREASWAAVQKKKYIRMNNLLLLPSYFLICLARGAFVLVVFWSTASLEL